MSKKILITGAAGFIGSALAERLAADGCRVVGIDNINAYYSRELKLARLRRGGFSFSDIEDIEEWKPYKSRLFPDFFFMRADITEKDKIFDLFGKENFDIIINLAAQAGVRYSLENPFSYLHNNIEGFLVLLEAARCHKPEHFIYASSSSVYGGNSKVPFSESDRVDSPVSLYAASKKSNELMAQVYSHLYGFPTTGLRFFTVYGPYGRPDMAPMLFSDAILEGRSIKVFNNGEMSRDFTYIDDIVEGVVKVVANNPTDSSAARIYNIGCGHPESLLRFISLLEEALGKKAVKEMYPMQPGDVKQTYADTSALERDFGYAPSTTLEEGIRRFAQYRLSL